MNDEDKKLLLLGMLKDIDSDITAFLEWKRISLANLKEKLRVDIRDDIDQIFASRGRALDAISDPRDSWKVAGLLVCLQVWGIDQETIDVVLPLVRCRSNIQVATLALRAIARFYRSTSDARISALLRTLLASDDIAKELRASVQSCLDEVCAPRVS